MPDNASILSSSTASSFSSIKKLAGIFKPKSDSNVKKENTSTTMNLASATSFKKEAGKQGWSTRSPARPALGNF